MAQAAAALSSERRVGERILPGARFGEPRHCQLRQGRVVQAPLAVYQRFRVGSTARGTEDEIVDEILHSCSSESRSAGPGAKYLNILQLIQA